MTHDKSSLEAALRDLQAATLDDALLQRLEAAADGTLAQLSREEVRFEEFLRQTSPAKLPPDFMATLEAIVHEVPFAVNEKIVLFPKGNQAPVTRAKRPMWAAAAAVALVGGLTALMIPTGRIAQNTASQTATSPSISSPMVSTGAEGNFVPASFNRGISEVHDEGVVWKSNSQPHSVVRVVYKDLITAKDKDGRTVQVEQPRVEYMLVPAKAD